MVDWIKSIDFNMLGGKIRKVLAKASVPGVNISSNVIWLAVEIAEEILCKCPDSQMLRSCEILKSVGGIRSWLACAIPNDTEAGILLLDNLLDRLSEQVLKELDNADWTA